ncbi:hypothetical protein AB3X91_34360 [Paraburkholderia sp. BR14263]|uniref:hypothetical protein n=1 Tax=unclassified Paraburkholderia TaxID=2615204 RepID=UPI0034CDFB0B
MEQQDRASKARARIAEALGEKSARQRGEEKTLLALDWIYRWGCSSPSIVDMLSGAAAAGLAARLVRRGLLVKTKTESGGGRKDVPNFILTLSLSGLEEVERVRDALLPYELDPFKIRQDQLRHTIIAQAATARNVLSGAINGFQSEAEMAQKSKRGTKQPDICWLMPDGRRVGVEVELTAKWGRDLDDFVGACLVATRRREGSNPRFDEIWVVTDSPAIERRYKAAFSPGAPINIWKKNEQRRWIVEKPATVPDWAKDRITCHLLK